MDNKSFARIAVWILVAVVLFTVFRQFETNSAQPLDQTSYTQFMDDAKAGKIRKVEVQGRKILVTPQSGAEYAITSPGDLWMVDDLRKNGVQKVPSRVRRSLDGARTAFSTCVRS